MFQNYLLRNIKAKWHRLSRLFSSNSYYYYIVLQEDHWTRSNRQTKIDIFYLTWYTLFLWKAKSFDLNYISLMQDSPSSYQKIISCMLTIKWNLTKTLYTFTSMGLYCIASIMLHIYFPWVPCVLILWVILNKINFTSEIYCFIQIGSSRLCL